MRPGCRERQISGQIPQRVVVSDGRRSAREGCGPATRTVAEWRTARITRSAFIGGVPLVAEYANGCRCKTVPTPLRDLGFGGRDDHRVVRLLSLRRPGC